MIDPLPTDRQGLIDRVRRVRFTRTRMSSGYDVRAVDYFFEKLAAGLQDPPQALPLSPAQITGAYLREVRILRGYSMDEVDEFRRMVAAAVRQLP
ncbi:MAG: hypothetical protein QOJ62_1390 [Actinomycetota bacterium]|jgi:DivIVA domain-containing protein|nr:hypothetical protein [Actinomycetota bacterium]